MLSLDQPKISLHPHILTVWQPLDEGYAKLEGWVMHDNGVEILYLARVTHESELLNG